MSAWSGKFLYLDPAGVALNQGSCEFQSDAEMATLSYPGGARSVFDLGDVDRMTAGEWDLQRALYTGRSILLKQFGAAFSYMAREWTAAWRARTVRCLLLEDLEEIGRYTATANGLPAEIRLF